MIAEGMSSMSPERECLCRVIGRSANTNVTNWNTYGCPLHDPYAPVTYRPRLSWWRRIMGRL